MEIIKRIKCDVCGCIIHPGSGFIFQGNVYIIDEDLNLRGGIIGNNFLKRLWKLLRDIMNY